MGPGRGGRSWDTSRSARSWAPTGLRASGLGLSVLGDVPRPTAPPARKLRPWRRQGFELRWEAGLPLPRGLTRCLGSGVTCRPGSLCTPAGRGAAGSWGHRGKGAVVSPRGCDQRWAGRRERAGTQPHSVRVSVGGTWFLAKGCCPGAPRGNTVGLQGSGLAGQDTPPCPSVHPKDSYQAGQDVSRDEHVEDVVPARGRDEPGQQRPQSRTCGAYCQGRAPAKGP